VDKEGHAALALLGVVDRLLALDTARPQAAAVPPELQGTVRIALPLDGAMLSAGPAACKRFLLVDVDKAAKAAATEPREDFPSEPGLWAGWLADLGVTVLLARGLSAADQAACNRTRAEGEASSRERIRTAPGARPPTAIPRSSTRPLHWRTNPRSSTDRAPPDQGRGYLLMAVGRASVRQTIATSVSADRPSMRTRRNG